MFSAVLALAVMGVALVVAVKRDSGAQKRTELSPVRVRVQRPAIERRRVR
jgi:hypothetical protein